MVAFLSDSRPRFPPFHSSPIDPLWGSSTPPTPHLTLTPLPLYSPLARPTSTFPSLAHTLHPFCPTIRRPLTSPTPSPTPPCHHSPHPASHSPRPHLPASLLASPTPSHIPTSPSFSGEVRLTLPPFLPTPTPPPPPCLPFSPPPPHPHLTPTSPPPHPTSLPPLPFTPPPPSRKLPYIQEGVASLASL